MKITRKSLTIFLFFISIALPYMALNAQENEVALKMVGSLEIFEKYQKSRSNKFDNFHEKYLLLHILDFPNIRGTETDNHMNIEDYDDPQKLISYKNKSRE